MKAHRRPFGAKSLLWLSGSIVLLYTLIGGLQPFFDRLFEGGTLLATSAWAQEQTLPPSNPAPEGEEEKEPAARQSELAVSGTFSNDPLARLGLALQEKQAELDDRESSLKDDEARLNLLRDEITKQFAELRGKRELLEAERDKFEARREAQRNKVSKKYRELIKAMPDVAARALEDLDRQLVLEILAAMETRDAKKILTAMPPERASALIESGLQPGKK